MASSIAVTGPDPNSSPTQMAEALRNLQHAVAQCTDVVFVTDSTGVITRINPAFEKLTGYQALDVIGKDLSLITEGGAQSAAYQGIWRSVFEEKHYAGLLKLRRKTGEPVETEVTVTPVRGPRGRVVSMVGTARPRAHPAEARSDPAPASPNASLTKVLHDVKNILMVAVAHADLARGPLDVTHPSIPHIEEAKQSALKAAALLRELTNPASSMLAPQGSEKQAATVARAMQDEAVRSATEASGHPPTATERVTILLVDDESLIRESQAELLQRAGFRVLSAGTGGDALDLANAHSGRIDLLITDISLPQLTGPELAEAIRSSHPETKVLAMSGHCEDWVLNQPGTPIKHHLPKPFSFSELENKIREVLCEKKAARAVGAS